MKQWIDRASTTKIKNFERMAAELTPHMTEWEIDQVVEFIDSIQDSRWDVNPTVEDCAGQLRLILGKDRYEQIKAQWTTKNQHLVKEGVTKYIHVATGKLYDGLDPEDRAEDYKKVVM